MTIDVYTATGTKKGTATLPKELFEADVNEGLMHQAVIRQQSNERKSIAWVKRRGDISGSTRKLFQQKGTGRARRGSIRSPLLRGGSKSFGPSKLGNFIKNMPKKMRRAALFSALSVQAKANAIVGLESYPEEVSTKKMNELLAKMPVEIGRKILIVTPDKHLSLLLSARNIPNVQVMMAQYLSPESVLGSRHIIFMVDALKKAEEVFGDSDKKTQKIQKTQESLSSASSGSSESSEKKSTTSSKSSR